jgi:hypothetical protein
MVKYLKHSKIDYERWDNVIQTSPNGLVYALSWYLDMVSPGWEALVDGDYDYIMPLPVKRKFGVPYLIQPVLTQQLGIFSQHPVTAEKVKEFLKTIPAKFIRCYLNLNSGNFLDCSKSVTQGVNYILPLNASYPELYARFDENTRRNIRKAGSNKISIASCPPDVFITNFRQNIMKKEPKTVFPILKNILQFLTDNHMGEIFSANNEKGECIAGACFIHTMGRIIYLVSFSSGEGKEKSAMFLLIEHILQEYSGSNWLLDFEGSSIAGVARFFKGFGATRSTFPEMRKGII